MSQLVRFLAKRFPWGPYARLQRGMRDPAGSQLQVLQGLLQKAAQTEFGRKHNFAGLLRERDVIRAYQKTVPLNTDADIRPDLDRMLSQEPDVLWPGTCRFGAVSGGTTTHGKLFPVGPDLLRHMEQFSFCTSLSYLADRGETDFLRGKILMLTGTVQPHPEYKGLLTGEMSGVLSHHLMRGKQKPPKWLAVPPCFDPGLSWEGKLSYIAERALDQDVRLVASNPCWGLHLMRRVLERAQQRGGKKPTTIGEVWPNLKLMVFGGFPPADYRAALEELIGLPHMQFREAYASTQASMALQTVGDDPALQLWMGGGIFFEFIPWEQMGNPNAARLTVDQVQAGEMYVPYLTTCGGLWSFLLDDIVRFSSVKPPKLFVVGRTSEILCSLGEGVLREHAQVALERAGKETDSRVEEYHLAPLPAVQATVMGHQLLVEFERAPLGLGNFTEAFDQALQDINPKYKKWRIERNFPLPELIVLPRGTFYRWLESTRSEVRSQSKIPRVRENRKIADKLLELAHSNTNRNSSTSNSTYSDVRR